MYVYSKNLRAQLFTPLVKLRKEILWKISAFKICFAGISSYQTNFYLENDKLAYMGFGFVWGSGKIFKERPSHYFFFSSLVLRAAQPFEKLSKPFLWKISALKICFMNSNPYQTNFYLENDKLAYVGFVSLWGSGKKFNVPRVSRKYPLIIKIPPLF